MPEPFRFNSGEANSVEDLLKLCQQFPDEAINYLIREDFEKWLVYLGKTNIAKYAEKARQASVSNEEKVEQFIVNCQEIKADVLEKQPEEPQESVNFISKTIQGLKNLLSGNRQKTQKQKLSPE